MRWFPGLYMFLTLAKNGKYFFSLNFLNYYISWLAEFLIEEFFDSMEEFGYFCFYFIVSSIYFPGAVFILNFVKTYLY